MPFALLIIGVVLLVAGVRNSQDYLFALFKGDFTGDGNFIFWFVSILIIGAIGYVPKLKPISTGFLVLVILALFLTKGNPKTRTGGFFAQFTNALKGAGGNNFNLAQAQANTQQTLTQLAPYLNSVGAP